MSEDTLKLKIPTTETKMERIREALQEDEDWRFGKIKLDGKKPRFELPAPTSDEPDNVDISATFHGVVLVAKKNFYQSDEDKEAGKDAKEKRALYILRTGKYMPELMYVSPTALRNWFTFVKNVVDNNLNYFDVMVEVSAEQVKSKNTGFVWSKPKFAIARSLSEEEQTYIATLRDWVLSRVQEYEDTANLAKYEEQALSVDKPKIASDEDMDEVKSSKKSRAAIEEEDEEPKPKKKAAPAEEEEEVTKKSKRKPAEEEEEEEPKPKKKAAPAEEEEEEPKPKKKKAVEEEEEEETTTKKSAGRAGYPNLDEDDEL